MIGQPEEAEPYTRRAIDMFKRTVGEGSRAESCEALLVRLKWYAGDPEAAGELLRALVARQTEAEAAGRASGLLLTASASSSTASGWGCAGRRTPNSTR